MYGRKTDHHDRPATPKSVRLALSTLTLGLAMALTTVTTSASAGSASCDAVIADPDSGCTQGERCDAATITCVKGGNDDTTGYVEICHRPPGCPGNTRTIRVSACALDAHLGHGDSIGTCPECDSDDDCPTGEVCNLASGICIEPNGGCNDDSDCGGGQICNPDTGLCQDPSDECDVDADCDDGLFCNGSETCDRLAGCKAGDTACDDGVSCTVDACDEDTDTCASSPSDAACDDGVYCNGLETCDVETGCVSGTPVDCGESDDFCAIAICDEESKGCMLEPQNDGLDCAPRDGDTCVLSAVCAGGACLVTPLCNAECERCDPEGCASLCGNPFANGDDVINTTDALFALRAAVELEECSLCICDVTGDGIVTATDTLMMLRQIVGLGDLFVCPDYTETETTTSSTTTTSLPEVP
jgi:Cys-rich repeat protein